MNNSKDQSLSSSENKPLSYDQKYFPEIKKSLMEYCNGNHLLLSLLYDLDLMPEQVKDGSFSEYKMFSVISHFKTQEEKSQPIITKFQEEVEEWKSRYHALDKLTMDRILELTQELEGAREKLMMYEEIKNLFKNSRPMNAVEHEVANKLFWSQFESPSVQDKEGKV